MRKLFLKSLSKEDLYAHKVRKSIKWEFGAQLLESYQLFLRINLVAYPAPHLSYFFDSFRLFAAF